jgi:hypothetical protein
MNHLDYKVDHPDFLYIGSINAIRSILVRAEKPARCVVCSNEPSKWNCVTVSPESLKLILDQQQIDESRRVEQSTRPRTENERLCVVVDDTAILDEYTRKFLLYNGRCIGVQKLWGSMTSEGFEQFDHVVHVGTKSNL